MQQEQNDYRKWLTQQSGVEILTHAYEYCSREDILCAMESAPLEDEQCKALYQSHTPLADIYHRYAKFDGPQMDAVSEAIVDEAYHAREVEFAKHQTPLYLHTAQYAKEHNELDAYRASVAVSRNCARDVEEAINQHFDGMHLDHDAARGVIDEYGLERVLHVLANTVRHADWDQRYSAQHKKWAAAMPNQDSENVQMDYLISSHPTVLDGFIDLALVNTPISEHEIVNEAQRLLEQLQSMDFPNSPTGTHFMAQISPGFVSRANTDVLNRLFQRLPFRSTNLTPIVGKRSMYVTINADEKRDQSLREPRSSVRAKLVQSAPRKATPSRKKREAEL